MVNKIKNLTAIMLSLALVISCLGYSLPSYAADNQQAPEVNAVTYLDNVGKLHYSGSPDNGYAYVRMQLTGNNLDKLDKSDFLFEIDGNAVELDDSAEFSWDRQFDIAASDTSSAEIHFIFPGNDLEKKRECKVTVLCAKDGVADRTRVFTMDAKPESTENKFSMEVDDWKALMASDGLVDIRIDKPEDASLNFDPADAADYIFFAGSNSEPYTDKVELTDADKVSMAGNVITVDLADKTTRLPAYVVLKTGALKRGDGKILGRNSFGTYHYAYIIPGAHIERMSFSDITLPAEGGTVSVTIAGSNLDDSNPEAMWVKVFKDNERDTAGSVQASDIQISEDGSEASFSFPIPANTTDRTVSYRFIPVVNGTNAVSTYIKGYDIVSVLPEGASPEDVTLSSVEMQGSYDMDDALDVFKTSTSSEQFTTKVDAVIRGTNLSSKKTVVKAVDENGVEWPMLPVFECGATIRWQNSSYYLPEKTSRNEQHIELLLPRRLGVPRTFKLYFAPDGVNFAKEPTGTVIIENEGLFDTDSIQNGMFTERDFTELRDIEVRYVDSRGNKLAESDHYKGYGITELYHMGIGPKEIEGYKLKNYTPANLNKMLAQPVQHESGEFIFTEGQWFVKDLKDAPITYVYEDESASGHDGSQAAVDNGQAVSPGTTAASEIMDLPAVKIAKPKAAKKSAVVKWKKVSKENRRKIGKIQIQYSTDKKFAGSDTKTRFAKKSKKSLKIQKLKAKKKYYVRVRAYKVVNGQIHVSKWSKVRAVKAR